MTTREMSPSALPIAGFPVIEATQDELAERLINSIQHQEKITLLYANSNFIVKCEPLLHRMYDDKVVIVNDGVGMDIAARLLHGRAFKANLNGTDFTPYLFQRSQRPLRVFMYGAQPHVVAKAAAYVQEQLGQVVVGYENGYADIQQDALISAINQAQPDVLLVAMGNPLQEAWILENRHSLAVPIVSGVGALFDFWAGEKPRAPRLVQQLRMEWFYRLCLEPRRLFRRYTIDILVFLLACLRQPTFHKTNPQ